MLRIPKGGLYSTDAELEGEYRSRPAAQSLPIALVPAEARTPMHPADRTGRRARRIGQKDLEAAHALIAAPGLVNAKHPLQQERRRGI
ncbi:hypothetical protein [Sinimarinibacterium flocculans]|uniref:hypothetical protein n=1 Tax=Sinimarinibacterium flocculans TaxID=985250 RepID=UPI0036D40D4D